MIGTLLTKIGGLFEKDYLFSSFLPALIFVSAVVAVLAPITGVDALSAWIDSWSTIQKTAVGTGAGVFVVVFGYVLHGMRPLFTRLWSGTTRWIVLRGFIWIGVQYQTFLFKRLRAKSRRISPWRAVSDDFRAAAKRHWSANHPPATDDEARALLAVVTRTTDALGPEVVSLRLRQVSDAYGRFSIDSLTGVYRPLKDRLEEWDERERVRIQRDTAAVDRRFGSLATIRATSLGNVIESFNRYPFTRYNIEMEIFWPRLQHVMKAEFLDTVRDQRILLDFSTTLASLAALYALLAIFAGPWIAFDLAFWVRIAAVASAVALFFYFLAVDAARGLGDLVRASFDLFRLDLLDSLGLERPASLAAERAAWTRVSRLVVYGDLADDIVIRPKGAAA